MIAAGLVQSGRSSSRRRGAQSASQSSPINSPQAKTTASEPKPKKAAPTSSDMKVDTPQASIAIKKSGSVAPSKKRTRDPVVVPEAAPTVTVKRVKLSDDLPSPSSTSTTPRARASPSTLRSSGSSNIVSSQKSDNPRVQFRKSIYTVLEAITTADDFDQFLKKEVVKTPGAIEVVIARGIVLKDETLSNKGSTKMDVSHPSTAASDKSSSTQSVPSEELKLISREIEEMWHLRFGRSPSSSSEAMDAKLRELRFALRKNPSLVARLVLRTLSAETMSKMSEEDMASEEERAALTQMRADDEELRNKVAESVDSKEHEKEMFKLRGKIEDRIIGALPTFVPKDNEDDDLEAISSSETLALKASQEPENATETSYSDSTSSIALGDSSSLVPMIQHKPLKATAKLDLDLGAINTDMVASFLSKSSEPERDEPSAYEARRPEINRSHSDGSEIRSILDQITFDEEGGDDEEMHHHSGSQHGSESSQQEDYDYNDTTNIHEGFESGDKKRLEEKTDSKVSSNQGGVSSSSSALGSSASASPSSSRTPSASNFSESSGYTPRTFRILDPDDDDRASAPSAPAKEIKDMWRGKLTFPDQVSDIRVSADWLCGASVERVFPRLGITSIDIGRTIEKDKMTAYLAQLASSASRAKVVLAFSPPAGDAEALANYEKLYNHLVNQDMMGVVPITGSIANERLIKEVYILPLPAGQVPDTRLIPALPSTPTSNRIYLCLIVDKKTLDNLNSAPSNSNRNLQAPIPSIPSIPSISPATLVPTHSMPRREGSPPPIQAIPPNGRSESPLLLQQPHPSHLQQQQHPSHTQHTPSPLLSSHTPPLGGPLSLGPPPLGHAHHPQHIHQQQQQQQQHRHQGVTQLGGPYGGIHPNGGPQAYPQPPHQQHRQPQHHQHQNMHQQHQQHQPHFGGGHHQLGGPLLGPQPRGPHQTSYDAPYKPNHGIGQQPPPNYGNGYPGSSPNGFAPPPASAANNRPSGYLGGGGGYNGAPNYPPAPQGWPPGGPSSQHPPPYGNPPYAPAKHTPSPHGQHSSYPAPGQYGSNAPAYGAPLTSSPAPTGPHATPANAPTPSNNFLDSFSDADLDSLLPPPR